MAEPNKEQMADEQVECVLLSSEDGEHYAIPAGVVEEFKVAESAKDEVAAQAAGGDEVAGFGRMPTFSVSRVSISSARPTFNTGSLNQMLQRGGGVIGVGSGGIVGVGSGGFRR